MSSNSNKISHAVLQATVQKIVHEVKKNPRQGFQNLVGAAEKLARGRLPAEVFRMARLYAQDESSPYFQLAENLVRQTNEDYLASFGVNLGLNSFSRGRKIIQKAEQERHFSTPWSVGFHTFHPQPLQPEWVADIVRQGKELGIYNYTLRIGRGSPPLSDLLRQLQPHRDCSFILFLPARAVTPALAAWLRREKCWFSAIDLDRDGPEKQSDAAKTLLDSGCLCGSFSLAETLSPDAAGLDLLEPSHRLGLPLHFLICEKNGLPCATDDTYPALNRLRADLPLPVLPLDLYADTALVGATISQKVYHATVLGDGSLTLSPAHGGESIQAGSLRGSTLSQLLAAHLSL